MVLFQPYRIIESEDPQNFNTIYEFITLGSKKQRYKTIIELDELNESGGDKASCTCPHFTYRALECKHIICAKQVLKKIKEEYGTE